MMKKKRSFLKKMCLVGALFFAVSSATFQGPQKLEAAGSIDGSFNVVTYNIAALPFPAYLDNSAGNPDPRVRYIGWRSRPFDIFAVQEQLSEISLFRHKTRHPYFSDNEHLYKLGNGIDVLSKFPMSITVREAFNDHPWYIAKGFTRNTMEVYPNVFMDVYNIHTGDSKSEITSQLKQIGNYIKNNTPNDRAVIVMGDFNARFRDGDQHKLMENLLEPNNLQDCAVLWTSPENGRYPGAFGESVDKIMFRSGEDLQLDLAHFERISTENTGYDESANAPRYWASHFTKKGKRLSDHRPFLAQFDFTVPEDKKLSAGDKVWLSDIKLDYAYNGGYEQGPVTPDGAVGSNEEGSSTGKIRMKGIEYDKGLGVHASSYIEIKLDQQYSQFKASVGLDDSTNGKGRVAFRVLADGNSIYDSGEMTSSAEVKTVDLDVSNVETLKLEVDRLGSNSGDRANWADAYLIKK